MPVAVPGATETHTELYPLLLFQIYLHALKKKKKKDIAQSLTFFNVLSIIIRKLQVLTRIHKINVNLKDSK